MLSDRLKLAMNHAGISQAELSRACGVKPPSVHGWLSGKSKFLRGENLLKAAAVLGVSQEWLATGKGMMLDHGHDSQNLQTLFVTREDNKDFSNFVQPVGRAHRADGSINIPMLAAKSSMGSGENLTYEGDQIIDHFPVSKDWLERTVKAKPQNLRVITGAGDSMLPTFNDGDLLLVDVSKRQIDIDGVYVLSAYERLFIKRVRQRLDGTFEVSSDNPTVKTVDVLNGNHQIVVHGRVVWAWNGRQL